MKMIIAFVIPVVSAVIVSAQPTPTPSGVPITDAELAKIPKSQIVAMLNHQHDIMTEAVTRNAELESLLTQASKSNIMALTAAGGALTEITTLNAKIRAVSEHDTQMTEAYNKAEKALWWYRLRWWAAWIMLGLGVAACLFFAFLKFTGRLSLSAAQVASKLP